MTVIEKTAGPGTETICDNPDLMAGILDTTAGLIVVLDTAGRIVFFNRACQRLTGFDAGDVTGHRLWDVLIRPEDVEDTKTIFADVAKGQPSRNIRHHWITKAGTPVLIEWSNFKTVDSRGDAHYVVGTGIDVSEDARLNEAVMEAEARFQTLLDTVPGAILIIDDIGLVYFFNRGAEKLFGYKAHEVTGSNVTMLMPSRERAMHDAYLKRYQSTGEPHVIGVTREVRGRRKDGSTFPMEMAVGEYQDGRHYFVGYIQDISDRRDAEIRSQEIQRQLREGIQVSALGQMGSVLAHELNQPLTALVNYLETMQRSARQDGTLTASLDPLLASAIEQAHRASTTMTNLRALFTGKQPALIPEHIDTVIDEALAFWKLGHDEENAVLTSTIDAGLPPVPMVRTQILQVLINLIQNGFDALIDRSGTIDIRCARTDGGLIHVTVTDNGRGLDPAIAENIYEPLATTKVSGMGLGLSICRSIIEAHGGRLWSTNGAEYTAFHFTLPAGQSAP